jgi:hypothetical protein
MRFIDGMWFHAGDRSQPCGIFQSGRIVIVVNERGAIAKAGFLTTQPQDQFDLFPSPEWGINDVGQLQGLVSDDGLRIDWSNGDNWQR